MSFERIDYVVVIDKDMKASRKFRYIVNFIKNLEEHGVKLQIKHQKNQNNVFITIHLPDKVLEYFAYRHDINIHNDGHTVLPMSTINIFGGNQFKTPLSDNRDIFERQGRPTTKERILVMDRILDEVKFGDYENEFSVEKLIRYGIAKAAYPLHDGDYELPDNEMPENDRQLLLKYWGNFGVWYKEQPLNLLEKYFGSEVAFYFAWVGFYNMMLVPAAFIGVVCSIISIVYLLVVDQERVEDICTSKLVMCPLCHSGKNCMYKPLNASCEYAKIAIIFDNHVTVVFAVFMSFWATFFVNKWTRIENTLKIRWNVEFDEMDTKYRMGYRESCSHRRWSSLNGTLEPYEPTKTRIFHLALSYATSIFLMTIVLVIVFAIIMFRLSMGVVIRISGSEQLEGHAKYLLQASGACLQALSIQLFGMFYVKLSEWLTELENPRTQTEYDQVLAHKRYFLSFWNNYASLFYVAFLKGRFYSPDNDDTVTRVETDLCHPTGCMASLCVQLSVLMMCKPLFGNVCMLMLPKIKKTMTGHGKVDKNVPQWEKEYELSEPGRHYFVSEYMEMIVQYGFVTFFVAAFPLAPVCALMGNCLELRVDAYKLLTRYRRPVPRQHGGIGAWSKILQIITHLSVATNAFVLAFTSDFVVREIYKHRNNGSLDGYIGTTLSLYDMRDYDGPVNGDLAVNPISNSTLCYYTASRHPPEHPEKYTLTPEYWYITGMRLLCVLVFEHVILITNGILSYFIPDVPLYVKETLHYNKTKELELKVQAHAAGTFRTRQRRGVKINRSENLRTRS